MLPDDKSSNMNQHYNIFGFTLCSVLLTRIMQVFYILVGLFFILCTQLLLVIQQLVLTVLLHLIFHRVRTMLFYKNMIEHLIDICDQILRKAAFHAHNIKTHFSPSNDSCTYQLTIHPSIDAESCPGYFCCGLFLRLFRCTQVLRSSSNSSIFP